MRILPPTAHDMQIKCTTFSIRRCDQCPGVL